MPDTQTPDSKGYWHPSKGGWSWVAGRTPPDWLVSSWGGHDVDRDGIDDLVDPSHTPHGTPNLNYDPKPAPPDVAVPRLVQVWQQAPHVPDEQMDNGGGGGSNNKDNEPGAHRPVVRVSPGGIRDAENGILSQTQFVVDAHNALKAEVDRTTKWIFVVSDPSDFDPYQKRTMGGGLVTVDPPDPNPYLTHKMTSLQHNVLKMVAGTAVLVGVTVSLLNAAAQAYAKTDIRSSLPPGPETSGSSETRDSR